jgi:hypothetical protein
MDDDGTLLLHNHPWPWSFSLILVGGYYEERRQPNDSVKINDYFPGYINYLNHQHFHRVDLVADEDAWSLFFTGWRSKKRSWGFWNRKTKTYRDWTTMSKAVE